MFDKYKEIIDNGGHANLEKVDLGDGKILYRIVYTEYNKYTGVAIERKEEIMGEELNNYETCLQSRLSAISDIKTNAVLKAKGI